MNNKLSGTTRILVLIASIVMIAVLFQAIWKIELTAPQYPEGLVLRIYAEKIGGDVNIVNGLNHYIGMRTLHTRDFVEFTVLPYIIGGFAALGLLVAVFRRRGLFYGWVFLFLLIAFTSMIDFYRWEYNYGHNLDEGAPIKVPGMAYQPPLIGYKQLLNFSAYSIPDIGGWLFVGVGLILAGATVIEIRRHRRDQIQGRPGQRGAVGKAVLILTVFFSTLAMSGCNSNTPTPIVYGQDACDFCRMGFSDRRFGFEICTSKGKVYKFDDMHCLLGYLKDSRVASGDIAGIYCSDFSGNGHWSKVEEAFFLESPRFGSPMGSNVAAFSATDSFHAYQTQYQANSLTWKELYR